jgi:hypothetical protein
MGKDASRKPIELLLLISPLLQTAVDNSSVEFKPCRCGTIAAGGRRRNGRHAFGSSHRSSLYPITVGEPMRKKRIIFLCGDNSEKTNHFSLWR